MPKIHLIGRTDYLKVPEKVSNNLTFLNIQTTVEVLKSWDKLTLNKTTYNRDDFFVFFVFDPDWLFFNSKDFQTTLALLANRYCFATDYNIGSQRFKADKSKFVLYARPMFVNGDDYIVDLTKSLLKQFNKYLVDDLKLPPVTGKQQTDKPLKKLDETSQEKKVETSASQPLNSPKKLFICYAHKDEPYKLELEEFLKLLKRQGKIALWSDRQIDLGTEWANEIDSALKSADIIVLLVSSSFLASNYCWDVEMKYALQMHEQKKCTVVPIILRPCDWQDTPFAKLQGLPKDMHPISRALDKDEAWTEVSKGIRKLVEQP